MGFNWKTFHSLFSGKSSGITRSNINSSNYQYLVDKPAWLSLSNPSQYRQAVADNPVLYGCIDILASAAANGKKYLVDTEGKTVPWDTNKPAVQNARRLFVDRPNPLQSVKEFNYERYYMFFTFGNNYVYLNNPSESLATDILTIQTLFNLPSEYMQPHQTGMLYDQIDVAGIVDKYCLTDRNPVREFKPAYIIHFNDINTSNVGNSIIGTSRLQNLKYPITNTQLAFEAMNVLLKSRGMVGIIKTNSKDQQGTQIMLQGKMKEDVDATFKSEYGILDDQKQYLFTYADVEFQKTVMSPEELGIYRDFSNNAMIICNGLKVPQELYKTYVQGATFENQIQAVRRLYQDAVIPQVENDDLYFTDRLNLRKYGLELRTDFSHIQALQEARKEKAVAISLNAATATKAYNDNMITRNMYLEMIEQDPEPNGDILKSQWDAENAKKEDQLLAQVIGVGGTQALTSIMTDANLTNEQKIQLLINLFAFEENVARTIVGTEVRTPNQNTQQ